MKDYVEFPTEGGHETVLFNPMHVVSVTLDMGGLIIKDVCGEKIRVSVGQGEAIQWADVSKKIDALTGSKLSEMDVS